MGSSNNQSVGTDKTTIFLLDGETDTVDEKDESENKNEHEEESNEERKPTRNNEEEDSDDDDLEKVEDDDKSTLQETPHQTAKAGGNVSLSSLVEEERRIWVPLVM